ncbi:4-oxalocrotonate tautomerase [Acuticoccus sediminis]|uniref:4-oxalocrotonate tautomerase n=1 Tax=Acuticoccus sediminis TaxID=2184697 RepID=A0A8B2NSB5_9HYPH|nr:2-hydroxymuconate tautomerase [Acuticoccus sediminis]RAH99169.1 4-oxalocrotonate tautomerase [Acuticoccus sediminis]
MPVLNMTIIKGRPQEKLDAMYEAITEAIHTTIGAPKESVRIIVNEVEPSHFVVAGKRKEGASS